MLKSPGMKRALTWLFISGACSLIYEIVWLRLLVLIFGNTAQSTAIVLSVFMAGLAMGSWIGGKIAGKLSQPLKLYASVELGIGFLALATPALIELARNWFSQHPDIATNPSAYTVAKLLASFVILFPATTLIGTTLPLIIQYSRSLSTKMAQQIGRLYAANTFGAVTGTFLAGFVLIETLGLMGSLWVGAIGNFFVGLTVIFSTPSQIKNKLITKLTKKSLPNPYTNWHYFLVVVTFTISGFIALGYELVLTRLIIPSVGTFIYGFSASLAIYLLGLASGSFVYQKWFSQETHSMTLIGWIQTAISFFSLSALVFIAYLIPLWIPHPLARLIAPIIVFYPLTVCLGMIFPAVTKMIETDSSITLKASFAYALNSLGSIFGSLIVGFILIPAIGSVATVALLGVTNALLAFGLILSEPNRNQWKNLGLFTSLVIIFVGLIAMYQANTWLLPRYIKVTLFHHRNKWSDTSYTFKEDTVASVLAVTSKVRAGKTLLIDGIGTTSLSDETKLLAHIPLLIHQAPKDVLVIALGMGTTFRSSLSHPQTQTDVVELVPSVPEVTAFFHDDASGLKSNPHGKIIINDGRNYVRMSQKRYDVVAIDPPPPDNAAGTTVLFSQEFYQDIKKILKPGGIVLGWFHYDVDVASYKMMLRAYLNEFPHVLAFNSPRHLGLYLVGSQEPLTLDEQRINKVSQITSVVADTSEWSGKTFDYKYLTSLYCCDQEQLTQFVGNTPAVSDYHPRSEYFLLRTLFNPQPMVNKVIDSKLQN